MSRTGVFICHCGHNIAGTVDVAAVADAVGGDAGVALAQDYVYMCSEPGQALVRRQIAEHGLDGAVVAACSPSMHESTFREAAASAGLNPYLLKVANIREQVSWPHQERPAEATRKATDVVRSVVAQVQRNEPLHPLSFPVDRRALVVGGGVAGMTASLSIAAAGHPVILVERAEQLGGHARELAETYLARGGGGLVGDRIEAVLSDPLIEVNVGARLSDFSGTVGNFSAEVAPTAQSPDAANAPRRVYEVGAVVVATGFDLYGLDRLPEYGAGHLPDVVDGLAFERMIRAGAILRPSDGMPARHVVWVQCAGSRDPHRHRPYCSKICCMYVAKQAAAFTRLVPDSQATVFYIDIRSQGRGYDEYVQQAIEEQGVVYVRGKVARVTQSGSRLRVWGADTLSGSAVRLDADMVVLASAAVPARGSAGVSRLLGAPVDESGFFSEAHPKLRPVESIVPGIFLAGSAQFPKDLPEAIAHAEAAASKVLGLFSQETLTAEPTVARVDSDLCVACASCIEVCSFGARSLHPWKGLAVVDAALCVSCGACAVACPNKATVVLNDTPDQILAAIEAMIS